jgi:hypothetical protein
MFTPEYFIDSVQNAKKQVVNTLVIDAALKQDINEVIDAQTAFVKTAVTNTMSIGNRVVKNFATGFAK